MRVIEKTNEVLHEIERINDLSFAGYERPNHLNIQWAFEHGEAFIYNRDGNSGVHGYAIVTQDGGHPFLWSLAVEPHQRGRGDGTFLLGEVIHYFEWLHAEQMDLTVHVNNPAQKLYFDHGFRAIRVLPRYYGEASGLRMRRKL